MIQGWKGEPKRRPYSQNAVLVGTKGLSLVFEMLDFCTLLGNLFHGVHMLQPNHGPGQDGYLRNQQAKEFG
jgi:hypothetical protein